MTFSILVSCLTKKKTSHSRSMGNVLEVSQWRTEMRQPDSEDYPVHRELVDSREALVRWKVVEIWVVTSPTGKTVQVVLALK